MLKRSAAVFALSEVYETFLVSEGVEGMRERQRVQHFRRGAALWRLFYPHLLHESVVCTELLVEMVQSLSVSQRQSIYDVDLDLSENWK